MQAEVLRRGGTVARTPASATVVNLGVDFVRWSPRDKPPAPLIAAGTAGALLTGAALASAAPYSTAGALAAAGITAGAWGIASEAALAMTPMSNTEAILQATIVTRDSVVMALREPVYIRNDDVALYARSTNLAPVPSWSASQALPVLAVRYDP